MFRSAILLALFVALNTCYAAPSANAGASAAIPGVAEITDNLGAALPDAMGTVNNVIDSASNTVGGVVNTASGVVNNVAGTAGNIAGGLPIAGPLLQQLLGTVLGLLGAVLGIAHQLPQPAGSSSVQAAI
ncbi:hypothetical protein ANCCAN_01582 [Ancylostoma caninum]|uniref:Uncharacterized protein n=1 Tax=Ancylostoma caninum TaxID=29170 RepID=A0A368H6B2_ANCCA|nr:hypothetical protein ANCCAN_01582 [Ancylostoma caninum]